MFASTYFFAQILTFACGFMSIYYVKQDKKCNEMIGVQVTIAFGFNSVAFLCSFVLVILTFFGCIKFEIDYIMMGRLKVLRRLTESNVAWFLAFTMDLCMISIFITTLTFQSTVFQGYSVPYNSRNCEWGVSMMTLLVLAYSGLSVLRFVGSILCYRRNK